MKAPLMEEPGEIGAQAEVGVGSDPRENEHQWRRMALAIERDAEVAAPFERRQLVSTGEAGHMDRQPPWPRYLAIGIQDRGGRRSQIWVPIRVPVLFDLGRTPGRIPYQAYRDPHDTTSPCVAPHLHLGSQGWRMSADPSRTQNTRGR
jgi:hypothetical protein